MEKNQAYTHLICAAQNMKNISIKRASIDAKPYIFTKIIEIFTKLIKISKNHVKENLTFFSNVGFVNSLIGIFPIFYLFALLIKSFKVCGIAVSLAFS